MLRASLLTATLFLTACGNPFFIEAQATSVCQHLHNQRFQVPSDIRQQIEALPPELQHGVEVSRTFAFDVNAQLPPELQQMAETHFALSSITLTAVADSVDLGFVDSAHVTLLPNESANLAPRQFDYARTEAAPRVVRWNGDAFDVAAYLQSGDLQYQVALTGSLPSGDVVVDVEACAEATVRLEYLQ